jgi:hypothetical protein
VTSNPASRASQRPRGSNKRPTTKATVA